MTRAEAPCALIVMGVSGSGKSTIAEALGQRLGWRFEDGDSFHPPRNVEKMRAGHPLTDEDRWPWLNAIADEIARVCERREHVIIACSALLMTSMPFIRDMIELLEARGLRQKYVVMVGGASVTEAWAAKVGADGTARNAAEAVKLARRLVGVTE